MCYHSVTSGKYGKKFSCDLLKFIDKFGLLESPAVEDAQRHQKVE